MEEFKNGIERLENVIGADLGSIMGILNIIDIPYSKDIIELRFGLRDGVEHTLFEVADMIKGKEESKNFIERYQDSIKGIGIKPIFGQWNAEAVRKSEATIIHIIREIIKK